MLKADRHPHRSPAYRLGAAVLFGGIAVLGAAWAYQLAGYLPCELCLLQRWAYYFAIPAAFLGLVLLSGGLPRAAQAVLALIVVAYLANAGLAGYHTLVEWKLVEGPQTCSPAGAPALSKDPAALLKKLEKSRPIRCDEPTLVLGVSMALWNMLASLGLAGLAIGAARAARPSRA